MSRTGSAFARSSAVFTQLSRNHDGQLMAFVSLVESLIGEGKLLRPLIMIQSNKAMSGSSEGKDEENVTAKSMENIALAPLLRYNANYHPLTCSINIGSHS